MNNITNDQKMEFVDTPVTLDREPARIIGRLEQYAIVWSTSNPIGVRFSWQTVQHIIENNNGEFKSL